MESSLAREAHHFVKAVFRAILLDLHVVGPDDPAAERNLALESAVHHARGRKFAEPPKGEQIQAALHARLFIVPVLRPRNAEFSAVLVVDDGRVARCVDLYAIDPAGDERAVTEGQLEVVLIKRASRCRNARVADKQLKIVLEMALLSVKRVIGTLPASPPAVGSEN